MAFTRQDLEALCNSIRKDLEQEPDWDENDGILEIAHCQHGALVYEYVKRIEFHDSYCHLEVVPEPLTGYVDISRKELLLPYSSIVAIDRHTRNDEKAVRYRLITAASLGHFYEISEGYAFAGQPSDPQYIESPAATLSRIYGLIRLQCEKGKVSD